jgi:nitrate reductase molybdenum cofactor assembly chaperone NarJ/NarW
MVAMRPEGGHGQLYEVFAGLLEYPDGRLPPLAADGAARVGASHPEAGARLAAFRDFLAAAAPGRIEELYTVAFDLQPVSSPYVGHHLFGENTRKRGAFLVRLKEIYAAEGFSPGNELPDHLAVVLRFLATGCDPVEERVLVEDGLVPALRAMGGAFRDGGNPYGDIIAALLGVLSPDGAGPAPRPQPRESEDP